MAIVAIVLILFPIVLCMAICIRSRKAMKESGIKVGSKVTINKFMHDGVYTVEKINSLGGCRIRKINTNKKKFVNIADLVKCNGETKKESPTYAEVSNYKTTTRTSGYTLPYVNCPNCGGKFGEGTEQNLMNRTCKCAYCDSVFSMLRY